MLKKPARESAFISSGEERSPLARASSKAVRTYFLVYLMFSSMGVQRGKGERGK